MGKAEKVNTPQVLALVSKKMGAYKKDCRELLEIFTSVIVENVAAGKSVHFAGLGVFYPFTSQDKRRPGQIRLKFRPSRKVAARVAAGGGDSEEEVNARIVTGQK